MGRVFVFLLVALAVSVPLASARNLLTDKPEEKPVQDSDSKQACIAVISQSSNINIGTIEKGAKVTIIGNSNDGDSVVKCSATFADGSKKEYKFNKGEKAKYKALYTAKKAEEKKPMQDSDSKQACIAVISQSSNVNIGKIEEGAEVTIIGNSNDGDSVVKCSATFADGSKKEYKFNKAEKAKYKALYTAKKAEEKKPVQDSDSKQACIAVISQSSNINIGKIEEGAKVTIIGNSNDGDSVVKCSATFADGSKKEYKFNKAEKAKYEALYKAKKAQEKMG